MDTRNFSVRIQSPCQQTWTAMTPTDIGRHCDACNLVVIDFSSMSLDEVKSYFQNNCGKKICGRFYESQLEGGAMKKENRVQSLYDKLRQVQDRYPKASVFVLAIFGLLALTGCPPKDKRVLMGDTTYVHQQPNVDSSVVDSVNVK